MLLLCRAIRSIPLRRRLHDYLRSFFHTLLTVLHAMQNAANHRDQHLAAQCKEKVFPHCIAKCICLLYNKCTHTLEILWIHATENSVIHCFWYPHALYSCFPHFCVILGRNTAVNCSRSHAFFSNSAMGQKVGVQSFHFTRESMESDEYEAWLMVSLFRSCANNYKLVSFLYQKMYHPDLTPATLDVHRTETCALACKAKRRLQFPSPSEVHITFKLLVCVSLTGDRPSVQSQL